jgi:hypothetical protein
MKTFRIYETGNNTGKKWYYAKQKYLFWYGVSEFEELKRHPPCGDATKNPECKRFNSKHELITTIKEAIQKDFKQQRCRESIYHNLIDEINVTPISVEYLGVQ